jgi:hypothetical protein
MSRFTVAGHQFELEAEGVERRVQGLLPDPIQEHYVVVEGRRFPPKQVLACVTGLDRADFTTHQARRVLRRLGFVAARVRHDQTQASDTSTNGDSPQSAALRPHVGKWVALASPTEVLVAAESPQQVLAWLAQHDRRAEYGMFRVPADATEAEGAAPE